MPADDDERKVCKVVLYVASVPLEEYSSTLAMQSSASPTLAGCRAGGRACAELCSRPHESGSVDKLLLYILIVHRCILHSAVIAAVLALLLSFLPLIALENVVRSCSLAHDVLVHRGPTYGLHTAVAAQSVRYPSDAGGFRTYVLV